MDNIKDVPFAVFETKDGQLIGKFKKTTIKKALKLRAYLEDQIKLLRHPNKCHRLHHILEKRGVKRHVGLMKQR